MSRTVSKHFCARCGGLVLTWIDGWKHASGWRGVKSCGRPPIPVAFRSPGKYRKQEVQQYMRSRALLRELGEEA